MPGIQQTLLVSHPQPLQHFRTLAWLLPASTCTSLPKTFPGCWSLLCPHTLAGQRCQGICAAGGSARQWRLGVCGGILLLRSPSGVGTLVPALHSRTKLPTPPVVTRLDIHSLLLPSRPGLASQLPFWCLLGLLNQLFVLESLPQRLLSEGTHIKRIKMLAIIIHSPLSTLIISPPQRKGIPIKFFFSFMWSDSSGDSRLMKYGKTKGQKLLLWLKKLT